MKAVLGRLFLLACLLASPAALGQALGQALAQTYPDRNVTIVVTSSAGALTDVLTRAVAQRLSAMWQHSVIVENKGGAGYSIAAQAVMRAEHDGYTLLASETGFYTTQPLSLCRGQAALRSAEGLRSGRRLRHHSGRASGESVAAGEFGRRPDRARQAEARDAHVRHRRRRHRAAHRRAGAGKSRRHQADGGALSRRGAGADRRDRRTTSTW